MKAVPINVVVLTASPNEASTSRTLAMMIAERIIVDVAGRIVAVDAYALAPALVAAATREDVTGEAADALTAVENADVIVVGVPTYRGSYPGVFKVLMDVVDQYALAGTPVLLSATAGSEKHAMMIDHALRPLFAFMQSWVAPTAVFATSGEFDGTTLLTPRAYTRIEAAVADVLPLLRSRVG